MDYHSFPVLVAEYPMEYNTSSTNFSFLLPTRGRPDSVKRLFRSIIETTSNLKEIEIILAVDSDDLESQKIINDQLKIKKILLPRGLNMGALNQACFKASSGRYVIGMNDDVIIRTKNWDQIVENVMGIYRDDIVLVHVNDLMFQDRLCTFPILSRRACLEIGFCPTEYKRYRIDDHIYDTFNILAYLGYKRILYLPDVIFEHDHYSQEKHEPDDVFKTDDGRIYAPNKEILVQDACYFDETQNDRKMAALSLAHLIENSHFKYIQNQQQSLLSKFHPSSIIPSYKELLLHVNDPFSYRRPDFAKKIYTAQSHPSSLSRVTVAIVSADIKSKFAKKCISLVKKHTTNIDLIILDNNKVADFKHSREINKVLRIIETDFLVLMDDDIYVEKNWLSGLMKCVDDETGVVVPLHKDKDGTLSYSGAYLAGDGLRKNEHLTDIPQYPREVMCLCSAILLIDLRKLRHIFMDEKYSKYFFDIVYGFEVWEAGYKVVCTPDVTVTHLGGETMRREIEKAGGLWIIDSIIYVNEWIKTGRQRKLEQGIWQKYAALKALVDIPKRINEVFAKAATKSDHYFKEEISTLVAISKPYTLFCKLLESRAQQYTPLLAQNGHIKKASFCHETFNLSSDYTDQNIVPQNVQPSQDTDMLILQSKLSNIINSKSWKITKLLLKARAKFVPIKSFRERIVLLGISWLFVLNDNGFYAFIRAVFRNRIVIISSLLAITSLIIGLLVWLIQ